MATLVGIPLLLACLRGGAVVRTLHGSADRRHLGGPRGIPRAQAAAAGVRDPRLLAEFSDRPSPYRGYFPFPGLLLEWAGCGGIAAALLGALLALAHHVDHYEPDARTTWPLVWALPPRPGRAEGVVPAQPMTQLQAWGIAGTVVLLGVLVGTAVLPR